jgi:tRNA-specific 2-thiouridylase
MKTGLVRLQKAVDPQRDQSHLLFAVRQPILKRLMMPLGGLQKQMVRKMADDFSVSSVRKTEDDQVCFVPPGGLAEFIKKRTAEVLRPKGIIRTVEGMVAGEHDGLYVFSIGQKQSIERTGRDQEEQYVVGFESPSQALIIGPESHLMKSVLLASDACWVRPINPMKVLRCRAMLRPRQPEAECRVMVFENKTLRVEFDQPQRAIAPGQTIVFYDGSEVLGGAFVETTEVP